MWKEHRGPGHELTVASRSLVHRHPSHEIQAKRKGKKTTASGNFTSLMNP
jgi:hypothetical protein